MINFDKQEIRECLSTENIFDLLQDWGAEPEYCPTGIICRTICHNHLDDDASRKLYYYENTGLFKCYTGCDSAFDIFELTVKVMDLQHHTVYDLNDAVRWIAARFGIAGTEADAPANTDLEDWQIFANYSRIQEIKPGATEIILKEYDDEILSRFNYHLKIKPWLDAGITQEIIEHAKIGYYLGTDQITIPHFDKDGRFIGLRGRYMSKEDCELYGKYRPIFVNGQQYNHPLGMNLYNFNNSRCIIPKVKKAIVFEGEKSCLLYQSYFGIDNDISVACCGSSLSSHHMELLMAAGAQEVVIAFDRQFQEIGDDEFNHLKKKLLNIYNKYKNYVSVSFIFDKNMITDYKDSPIDKGPELFSQLFKERIIL